jgi:hypothetical protein
MSRPFSGSRNITSTKPAWKQVASRALLQKLVTVYCETHMKRFLMLKEVVHTVPLCLQRLSSCILMFMYIRIRLRFTVEAISKI